MTGEKEAVAEKQTANLLSVSSSLRVLCASSSWTCSAAIFSVSHSSCCTLSILFSCCSLMNFSLNNHTNRSALAAQKVNRFYTVRCGVCYLYSMGINSAARLSWLGLPEGSIPTWRKHAHFRISKWPSSVITVRHDYEARYLLGRAGAVEPECIAAPHWSPLETLSLRRSSNGGGRHFKNQ